MTVTVADIQAAGVKGTLHLDAATYWQNNYASEKYPRFTVIEVGPRGRHKDPVEPSRTFYVDDVRCATLEAVAKRLSHPKGTLFCGSCEQPARLTDGREIYPHRPDLAERNIWKCDGCGGYVGCHPRTKVPLGTPANAELRKARKLLHEQRFDHIWKTADRTGGYHPEDEKARWRIRRAARTRLYGYLAQQLAISSDLCHIGMFDIETCRRAWVALKDLTYPKVREWAKKNMKDAA